MAKKVDMDSEVKCNLVTGAAEDKKANYITALDLRGKTVIADFFVICSGTSNIHLRAIADGIMEALEKHGVRQRAIEGYSEGTWILLDYGDVVAHIMSETQRDYYKIEKLWGKPSEIADTTEAVTADCS
jgi:ribosome-associated protein